jgi:hypothetical protein
MFALLVGLGLVAAPQSDAGVRLAWYEFDNLVLYGRFETLHVDQYEGGRGSRADYLRAGNMNAPLFYGASLDLATTLRAMSLAMVEVTGPQSPRVRRKDLEHGTPVEALEASPGPSLPYPEVATFDGLTLVGQERVLGLPARHYRLRKKSEPVGLFAAMEQRGTETWAAVDAWYVDPPPAWKGYLAAMHGVPVATPSEPRDPFARLATTERGLPVRLEVAFEFRGKPMDGTADSLFTMMGMKKGRLPTYRAEMLALDSIKVPAETFEIPQGIDAHTPK